MQTQPDILYSALSEALSISSSGQLTVGNVATGVLGYNYFDFSATSGGKAFRDRATAALAEHRQLACGQNDIISSGGGYHFQPWIVIRIENAQEQQAHEPAREPDEPDEPGEPLNERQKWILMQLRGGAQLRLADIIRHTRKNRSTINRDLKDLRAKGLITSHPLGYYILLQREAAKS